MRDFLRKNFYFDPESYNWLARQPNASAALRELIHERIALETGLGGERAEVLADLEERVLLRILAEIEERLRVTRMKKARRAEPGAVGKGRDAA